MNPRPPKFDARERKTRNRKTAILVATGICCLVLSSFAAIAVDEDSHIAEPLLRQFVNDSRIDESSGLARSLVTPNRFWTHNDSGDSARLFAIDTQLGDTQLGDTKSLDLEQQTAVDWEDITSGVVGDRNWIIVGDVGDNARKRTSVQLYAFEEPQPNSTEGTIAPEAIRKIEVTYPDGPGDCEAIALDAENQRLLMIKKTLLPIAGVYAVDLKILADKQEQPTRTTDNRASDLRSTAKHLLTLPIPMITAMDIRSDGLALAITTYRDLFVYQRKVDESWEQALQKVPQQMVLPKLRQIEAVAFDQNGELWITSERSPMALFKVDLRSLSLQNQ